MQKRLKSAPLKLPAKLAVVAIVGLSSLSCSDGTETQACAGGGGAGGTGGGQQNCSTSSGEGGAIA